MPLTTARGQITTQTGNITQVVIAEQVDYGTPVTIDDAGAQGTPVATEAKGFYRFQPKINSADIAREGETLATAFFDGSSAQTLDAPGRLNITNGFAIALSGNGTPLVLRMLTQDRNPTHYAYGGDPGDSIPAEIDIVPANSALASTATSITSSASFTSPVRPNFTTSTSASLASGQSRATVRIFGTDNDGTAIDEVLTFSNPSGTNARNTRLWFKTITSVQTAGWDVDSAKTFSLKGQDKSETAIFVPYDDDIVAFWTAEVTKGITPNTYNGLCMQSATIEITGDALVSFDCTFLGREGKLYTNLANQIAAPPFYPKKTDISALSSASQDVYGGWQTRITAEGTEIAIGYTEGTYTLNQEMVYTNALGDRIQTTKPVRGAKRLVQLEASVLYALENNFSTYFESNQPIPNVKITWSQSGLGAYPYELVCEMPLCQLTADPDPAVADPGVILQNVVMKAVKDENFDYEYRFVARYSDYEAVRTYS